MNSTPISTDRAVPGRTRSPRTNVGELIADALRREIVALRMRPGETLDKGELAERFGVSRFPVSEALNQLRTEGLVEIRPQSGSCVSHIRLSDMEQDLLMRRALEAEIVERLALLDDPRVVEDLKRNLRYQRTAIEADDSDGFHELDLAFHDALAAALSYPRLRATVEKLRLSLDRARRLVGSTRRLTATLREHEAIVDGLEQRDAQLARRAMTAHIDTTTEELRAYAARNAEIFARG
jgi:DNA-binding GntR family transcriptional regulator